MKMTDRFIMISKAWTEENEYNGGIKLLDVYGSIGLGFYIYCRMNEVAYSRTDLADGDYDSHVGGIGDYLDMMGFTVDSTRRRRKEQLLKAIKLMEKDKIITFYSNLSFANVVLFDAKVKNNKSLYCNVEKFSGSKFIRITKNEFANIMECDTSSRLELLIHFVALMHFENNIDKVCYPSFEKIADINTCDGKTITKYNDVLCSLELLYYSNPGMKYIELTNSRKSFPNVYGRFVNSGKVDDFVEKTIAKEKGLVSNTTKDKQQRSRDSRSLIGVVNYLNRKEKKIGLTAEETIDRDTKQIEYDELRAIIKKDQDKSYEHLHPKKDKIAEVIEVEEEPTIESEPVQDDTDDECDYEFIKYMGLLEDEEDTDKDPEPIEVKTDEELEIEASINAQKAPIINIADVLKKQARYKGVDQNFLDALAGLEGSSDDFDMDIDSIFG